jgi:hypothetical protein
LGGRRIANSAAEVEKNQRDSVRKLAQSMKVLATMVHTTLHKDLQLSKKLARWLPKLRTRR